MPAMNEGGPFTMMILGLGGLGLLVILALTGLGLTRRRVPLTLWLLMPLVAAGVGALGAWTGAGTALVDLSSASSEALPDMANRAYAESLMTDVLGRWVGAVLLVLAAWGAGLGAVLRGDREMVPTWFAAVVAILVAVLGGVLIAAYGFAKGVGPSGYALAGLLAFGGVGVGVGAFRRAIHEHAFRVAGMRFASGVSLMIAVAWAGTAMVQAASAELHEALSVASSAAYAETLTSGVHHAASVGSLAWMAFAIALFVGGIGFFSELGDVVQRGTLADMCGVLVLVAAMFVVRSVEHTRTATLGEIGNLAPLAAMVGELNYELPGAGVMLDEVAFNARPRDGGFGDVLLHTGDDGWVRRFEWTGSGWHADDTRLAEARLGTDQTVLLVASGDVPAADVLSALQAAGGQGLLLMRMNELDSEASPEAKARQGTLLPLQIASEASAGSPLWLHADTGWLFSGPVRWYGEGDDERKAFARIFKAFEASEATGLNVVFGDRAKVRNIAEACLPAMVERGEDGQIAGAPDRFCALAAGDVDTSVEAAAVDWSPPAVERVTLWQRAGRGLDDTLSASLLGREIGAFDYCATKFEPAQEGDALAGRVQLEIMVNAKGVVDSIVESARSQVTDRGVIDCARSRVRPLKFSEHESEEPIAIDLVLTYR